MTNGLENHVRVSNRNWPATCPAARRRPVAGRVAIVHTGQTPRRSGRRSSVRRAIALSRPLTGVHRRETNPTGRWSAPLHGALPVLSKRRPWEPLGYTRGPELFERAGRLTFSAFDADSATAGRLLALQFVRRTGSAAATARIPALGECPQDKPGRGNGDDGERGDGLEFGAHLRIRGPARPDRRSDREPRPCRSCTRFGTAASARSSSRGGRPQSC